MKGVWDGLDQERVSRGVTTAFYSDEYLDLLARINNSGSVQEVLAAREDVKAMMALWRQECPEYAFMVDCLFLFSEKLLQTLPGGAP